MNTAFFVYCALGIVGTVWARYSSQEKISTLAWLLVKSVYDDLARDYFESLLELVYSVAQGSLFGLALAFFVSSPIPYQDPQPILSLLCIVSIPVVRLNYEFTLVVYKFFGRRLDGWVYLILFVDSSCYRLQCLLNAPSGITRVPQTAHGDASPAASSLG